MSTRARTAAAIRVASGGTRKRGQPLIEAYLTQVDKYGNGTQARSIRERFNADAELIRSSDRYSDKGKQLEIARRYVEAREQLDTLRAEFRAGVEAHRTQLQRGLFGPLDTSPEQIQSHRAAHALAKQLGSKDEALSELRWAHLTNDHAYARAIVHHATEHGSLNGPLGWGEVIDAHDTKHPGTRTTLQEIADLPDGSRLKEDLVFGLPAPKEITGMDKSADPLPYAERLLAEEPATDDGAADGATDDGTLSL